MIYSSQHIGATILHYPETHSTNDLAKQLLTQHTLPDGCVIRALHQTAGRGQEHATWEDEAGKNLLLTYIIKMTHVPLENGPLFNKCVSLAIRRTLSKYIKTAPIHIKWPNDIYVDNKKIAGILIENIVQGNQWKYSLVGIGININQIHFKSPNAISLSNIGGKYYDLDTLLSELSKNLNEYFNCLSESSARAIKNEYESVLYLLQTLHSFEVDGETVSGSIQEVDDYGRLIVKIGDVTRAFHNKQIKFI